MNNEIPPFDGYVFDLDGVIWRGDQPIPGAAAAVNALSDAGHQIRFLTNNASAHRRSQCEKLISMGIAAELSQVINAGYATAVTLFERYGPSKVHVMGTDGLEEEMREAGHQIVSDNAEIVVVGFDRSFTYEKLERAFRIINLNNARFVACNENPRFPNSDGISPGIGPSVAALACCVGRAPDLVVGKPNAPIMKVTLDSIQLPAERCLMVADLLELDIKGANIAGLSTLFVLSGLDTREDIERTGVTPTFILDSVAQLNAKR